MKKYVLNLGINTVDRDHYKKGLPLNSGPKVAQKLNEYFLGLGFDDLQNGAWIDKKVNSADLKKQMLLFQEKLVPNDILVVTFCGHTIRVKKEYTYLENAKNEDEGWALYDEVFFHFEFWKLLKDFKPGVKVILLVDSCYSGVMESTIRKGVAKAYASDFLRIHKEKYNEKLILSGEPMHHEIQPAVVIISASAEDQKAQEIRDSKKLTFFYEAIREVQNQETLSLSSFFDNMSYSMQLIQSLHRSKKKSFAQWFYLQGHKHTDLRTQTPPFGE